VQNGRVTPSGPDTEPAGTSVGALVEHHRTFLRFLERRVGSREIAEDILQEAFGRAIEHVESVRVNESIVAWFYRVLRNAVVDHYRRTRSSQQALAALAAALADPVHAPELDGEVCRCVAQLASSLKPEYAAALQQVDIEGTSVKSYAQETGITPNNAAVRVFRAREALRRRVMASCGTCAAHGCVDCDCRAQGRQAQ
jgi:RNA polymerase sigma factor (sigma-70 family)